MNLTVDSSLPHEQFAPLRGGDDDAKTERTIPKAQYSVSKKTARHFDEETSSSVIFS